MRVLAFCENFRLYKYPASVVVCTCKGGKPKRKGENDMKKYQYRNIKLVQSWGTWDSYYSDGNKTLQLTATCSKTKKEAYEIAKSMVDYLNNK